jgi:hypothetical protein
MCETMAEVAYADKEYLDQFKAYGMSASFHYADDTCKEWDLADRDKRNALRMFDRHLRLQPAMREIAKHFLWSLNNERPVEKV